MLLNARGSRVRRQHLSLPARRGALPPALHPARIGGELGLAPNVSEGIGAIRLPVALCAGIVHHHER